MKNNLTYKKCFYKKTFNLLLFFTFQIIKYKKNVKNILD